MEASVYTTGFDIEDAEKCTEVFHSMYVSFCDYHSLQIFPWIDDKVSFEKE